MVVVTLPFLHFTFLKMVVATLPFLHFDLNCGGTSSLEDDGPPLSRRWIVLSRRLYQVFEHITTNKHSDGGSPSLHFSVWAWWLCLVPGACAVTTTTFLHFSSEKNGGGTSSLENEDPPL